MVMMMTWTVMWRHPAILAPFSGLEGPYVCLRYLPKIMLKTMMMIGDDMIILMIRIISREVSDGSSEIGFDLWSLCDHWSGWDQVRSHKDQVWSGWDQMRSESENCEAEEGSHESRHLLLSQSDCLSAPVGEGDVGHLVRNLPGKESVGDHDQDF